MKVIWVIGLCGLVCLSAVVFLVRTPKPPANPVLVVETNKLLLPSHKLVDHLLGNQFRFQKFPTQLTDSQLWGGLQNLSIPWSHRALYLERLVERAHPEDAIRLVKAFLAEKPENQGAFAKILIQSGSKGFRLALESFLFDGNDAHAAAAIRGLAGLGGNAEVQILGDIAQDDAWPEPLRREAALGLLGLKDQESQEFALKSLAMIGSEPARAALAQVLFNGGTSASLRIHSAMALGELATASAAQDLILALEKFPTQEMQETILDALARCPYESVADTFERYLRDDAGCPPELRAAAAEALAQHAAQAAPLLLDSLAKDSDERVREMAAWALSNSEPGAPYGSQLASRLTKEKEPDVRRRIYEALLVQAENPAPELLGLIESEPDLAARIAGFNAWADAIGRRHPNAGTARFDSEIVPELEALARSALSANLRMRAVFALRRAATPAATAALQRISQSQSSVIATAALNGLQNQN